MIARLLSRTQRHTPCFLRLRYIANFKLFALHIMGTCMQISFFTLQQVSVCVVLRKAGDEDVREKNVYAMGWERNGTD